MTMHDDDDIYYAPWGDGWKNPRTVDAWIDDADDRA